MRRFLIIAAIVVALPSLALAADDILRLKTGKVVVGKIVAVDEAGVTLARESGEARYDWASLTPLCQYEIRADRVAVEDAEAHEALALIGRRSGTIHPSLPSDSAQNQTNALRCRSKRRLRRSSDAGER